MSRSICGVRAVSFDFPPDTDEMSSGQRLSHLLNSGDSRPR